MKEHFLLVTAVPGKTDGQFRAEDLSFLKSIQEFMERRTRQSHYKMETLTHGVWIVRSTQENSLHLKEELFRTHELGTQFISAADYQDMKQRVSPQPSPVAAYKPRTLN